MKNKLNLIGGFTDIRTNNEDFFITPAICGFWHKTKYENGVSAMGLSITWGYYSLMIGISHNKPKLVKKFIIKKYKKK